MDKLAIISIAVLSLVPNLNYKVPVLDTPQSNEVVSNFVIGEKPTQFPDRSKEAEIARQIDVQREQARQAELQRIEAEKQAQAVQTTTPAQIPVKQPQIASDDIYMQLAYCESGARWDYNGSSGYDGAFQFSPATWNTMGTGYAFAYLAPPEVQIDAAKRLIARSGWSQFPLCAKKLGML